MVLRSIENIGQRRRNQFTLVVALGAIPGVAVATALIADLRAQLHPVTGSVSIDGIVPAGAELQLTPLEVDAWMPTSPTAIMSIDGGFRVKTLGYRDGARPGEYAVTIIWQKVQLEHEELPLGPNLLPPRYAKAATTPWQIEVVSGTNELSPLTLSCYCSDFFEPAVTSLSSSGSLSEGL